MGVYFSISALLILIVFAINFFMKQRVKNSETESYKYLMIITLIGLALEIFSCYLYNINYSVDSIFFKFISKSVLCYYIIWSYLFANYIIGVCDGNIKIKKFILLLMISGIISIMICPIYYNALKETIVPFGEAVYATYLICFAYMLIDVYYCIKYRKKIVSKKFVPLYLFAFLALINVIINFMIANLFLIGYILAYDIIIMYFTIENPDVKLVNQLELAKDEAEKANNAKTDFLSSMSHEIRTPLNAIVGFSECINDATDLDEAKSDAKDIIMASQNLLEIVNGILDINKIEANKMEIVNTDYNLLDNLNNLSKLAKARIGEKDIELRCHFAKDLPKMLYGDCAKLKQIITNLLTNAVKYTEKGYIDFTVNSVNNGKTSKLMISVRDTGRGIKKENIDKLFTKFERLDEDRNTTIEGTGLGLAITKKIVEMMGGKIVVNSTYGEGSDFVVYLKQEISNKKEIKEEKIDDKEVIYPNSNILIVDDNLLNLKVIDKLLKPYQVNTTLITSGKECLENISKENYDLIFLDIMMPKMDGIETLNKLKENSNFKIPTIALTADVMSDVSNKYLEKGFTDYLAKPIDVGKLKKILSKYLKAETKKEESVKKKIKKDGVHYLKENGIDIDNSLSLLGDINMYNEILKTFVEESKKRIPRIKKNKETGNMKDYAIDVHAMKSDSKYLGFKKLAEVSYEHELKSKENDIKFVNEHFDKLMNEYEKIKKIIDNYKEDEK